MSINNDGQYVPVPPTDPAFGQTPEPSPKKPRSPWIHVAIATAAIVLIGGLGTAAVAELTSHTSSTSSTGTSNSSGTFNRSGNSADPLDNNGDNLTRTASGAFTFATSIASGATYNVTILTQPTG